LVAVRGRTTIGSAEWISESPLNGLGHPFASCVFFQPTFGRFSLERLLCCLRRLDLEVRIIATPLEASKRPLAVA
jgi:hypothetical protein